MLNSRLSAGMLSLALLGLACAKAGRSPSGCTKEEECGTGSFCIERTCVVDSKPVAAFTGPASPTALELLTFDGSASSDPDSVGGQDAVVSYTWTFTAVTAACDAPAVAGNGPSAAVRFACPGSYDATLVVTDRKGLPSEPFTTRLEVAENAGPPPVTAGPDLVRPHACDSPPGGSVVGAPGTASPGLQAVRACTVRTEDGRAGEDPVLSASSSATPVGELRYHWSVTPPPGLALSSERVVVFSPSPNVSSPKVHIEVIDGAISGDWVFQVEARDDAGLVGTAATRLSVTNRPPEIAVASSPLLPHRFDAATAQLTASGTISGVAVTDPDGDPIAARTVTFPHTGDGAGTFDGTDLGTTIQLRISVPYRSAADGQYLIGGAGLERAVVFEVQDVNGAITRRSVNVLVANTLPVLDAPAEPTVTVSHHYAFHTYSAQATLGHWTDPDGDPLTAIAVGPGDPDCSALGMSATGTASVKCTRAFNGTLPSGYFGAHTVAYAAFDAWGQASSSERLTVNIANQPPTSARVAGPTVTVSCTPTTDVRHCCEWGGVKGTTCIEFPQRMPALTYTFTPPYSDADGDPVLLTAGTEQVTCDGRCPEVSASIPAADRCDGGTAVVNFDLAIRDDPDPGVPATPGAVHATIFCE